MTSSTPASKDQVVGELHPAHYNPRQISPEGLDNLAASLKEFGDLSGVVKNIRTNNLIGGHQRVKIFKPEWPVEKVHAKDVTGTVALGHIETPWGLFTYREVDWEEAKEISANISANKIRSAWDDVKLIPLVLDLKATAYFDLTGFKPLDIKMAKAPKAPVRDVETAPLPRKPVTKAGDIWKLGAHRLMCGDSVDVRSAEKLLPEGGVDCILMDPPYCSGGFQEGSRAQGSVGTKSKKYTNAGKIHNDILSSRGYQALIKSVLANFKASAAYVFTDWRMWINLFDVMESKGFGVRSMIVWDKGTPGMGMGWRAQHEIVMFAASRVVKFDGHVASGNVVQVQRTGNIHHTTEKPVALLEKILTVQPAQTIADPFSGSGSTLIACENLKRTCYAMELSPGYCDVTVERWEALTGEKAKRG